MGCCKAFVVAASLKSLHSVARVYIDLPTVVEITVACRYSATVGLAHYFADNLDCSTSLSNKSNRIRVS